jgi:hypothetical protein
MNREELLLELDGRDRVFQPCDPITGRIRVGNATRSVGRSLVVAMWWQTTGGGSVEQGDEQVIELAAADAAIEGRTFPFSFPSALGPLSYNGKTFSIEWRVEARLGSVDRGGGPTWQGIVIEADRQTPVRGIGAAQLFWLTGRNLAPHGDVTAVLSRERVSRLLEDKEAFDHRAHPAQLGCLTFFFAVLFLWLLTLPLEMIAEWRGAGDLVSRYGNTAVMAIAALLVIAMLVLLGFSRRIERDLGLTVWLADRIVRPGDDLVCTIRVHAVRRIGIAGAEVRVTAEELSTSSSPGEAGDATRVELFQSTVIASPARTFRADTPEQFIVRIPLPHDAAATFESRYHRVEWLALVSLKLGKRTSIDRRLMFVVYPNGASRSATDAA